MASAGIVIIGGGVSGLSTAYFLAKLGLPSTIVEKSGRLGGLIGTDLIQGCQLEAGPDSYLAAKPAVTELAAELGDLKSQIIDSNDGQRRVFVVRQGKLIPMPKGMVMMAPGQLWPALRSDLFSVGTKLRFLMETRCRPRRRPGDVSVEEFVKSHFGKEVFDYAAEPLLSGVYGGDATRLSAESVLPRFVAYEREQGSLIQGVRQERRNRSQSGSLFRSFRGGMQSLTDSLAQAIAGTSRIVFLKAAKVETTATGWRVSADGESIDADQLVLACPASASATLIETALPSLAAELGTISYSSAILVTLVYRRAQFQHALNGFGFLVPRAERQAISAATWVSTKFPSRVPEHLVAMRAFIVDPQATQLLKSPEEIIIRLVHEEFVRLMGIEASAVFGSVRFWPGSMPQYTLGHEQRRLRIAQLTAGCRGLHLVGNAYEGVGIPDCVRLAKETAKRIRQAHGAQEQNCRNA